MSLKIKTAARLKALFAGVALSKKTVDAIGDQMAKAGLTDESTDEEIDVKLNERNAIHSFEDQKKFDDYQVGKATKEAADKEAKRLADIAAGKQVEEEEIPADTPEWAKAFMKAQKAETEALKQQLASVQGEKVTTTRREQYAKAMTGKDAEFIAKELKKFDKMAFADDEDFTTTLAEFTQDVANSDLGKDQPNGGFGGAQTPASTKVAPAVVAFIAKQTEARKTVVGSEN